MYGGESRRTKEFLDKVEDAFELAKERRTKEFLSKLEGVLNFIQEFFCSS